MSGSLPKLVEEPAWLRQVAPESMLNVRDVAEIFQVHVNSLWEMIRHHSFPTPDDVHQSQFGATKHRHWKVSTIRAEILRRKQLHNK